MNQREQLEKAIEVALLARDLIWEGWCQGALVRDALGDQIALSQAVGSKVPVYVCSAGALDVAISRVLGPQYEPSFYQVALDVWYEATGLGEMSMSFWNDAKERTQAEVADSWDKVAKELKERLNALEVSA